MENKSKKSQELIDKFATAALSALINKMPFYDEKGEFGIKIGKEELQEIKKELTATAYGYADWMLIARENNKQWLEENQKHNPNFGS
jgi:hypothetical protein